MSFARGLALAAIAAQGMATAANDIGRGFALSVPPGGFFNDPMAEMLSRRISYGRSHYAGHRGQFGKKVDRQRRRNQMRRLTHQQQRRAG